MTIAHRSIPPLSPQDEKRFWNKVQKGKPDECWEWRAGRISAGYGEFVIGNHVFRAHRVAWVLANKQPIPGGFCVLHRCDNPPCVAPHHLFLGTIADNNTDKAQKGRTRYPVFCGNEHWTHKHPELVHHLPHGEQHWHAKLTANKVREIRHRYAVGGDISQPTLAREFGVSQHAIWCIIHRKTWRHLP